MKGKLPYAKTDSAPAELPEGRIMGRIVGPEPADEGEHFMTCLACGQAFDMRDLGAVLHHSEPDHTPHPRS